MIVDIDEMGPVAAKTYPGKRIVSIVPSPDEAHPAVRGDEIELGVSRIEKEGRPLDSAEIREYQSVLLPLAEKTLSGLNKIQGDRSVHNVRIESGNLVLSR